MDPNRSDFDEIADLKAKLSGFEVRILKFLNKKNNPILSLFVKFEFFQTVYREDVSLFVDLGGLEAPLNFDINDNGSNVFHLAVFRGR